MVGASKDKSTFGTRMPIDIRMLNEIINREVKHFRNYKTYRPSFGSIPVAGKFYAAHDALKETPGHAQKVEGYSTKVAQARAKGPRGRYPAPVTTNQTYGWYDRPITQMDRNDTRFYHPKRESTYTKVEIIIQMSNPNKKK